MKNKKVIEFASDLDFIELPKPSIRYIPDWYKKTNTYIDDSGLKIQLQKTFKHCMPFFDALDSGYIYEIWSDLEVTRTPADIANFYWRAKDHQLISSKTDGSSGLMKTPVGYDDKLYSFEHNLYIKTPPGYSVLITQPFNRTDLPFYALSGVVDTDIHPMFPGSYPIFLKSGFSGIINRGTPILQIIPFKRDSWVSIKSDSLKNNGSITRKVASAFLEFWYKKNAWSKKNYE